MKKIVYKSQVEVAKLSKILFLMIVIGLVLMFFVIKRLELTKHIVQKTKEDDKSHLTKSDK